MKIHQRPSPNFDQRPMGTGPSALVLHYTGMRTMDEALARLCDRQAKVSAHYCIAEQGEVFRLVDETARAWHAGQSHWRGRDGVNDFSIGIEIVNPGHEFGYCAFPEAQMTAVEELCADIIGRHDIEAANVVGHSDVAPDRKQDPGELFDWQRLAKVGAGLWLGELHDLPAEGLEEERPNLDWMALQRQLGALGYGLSPSGAPDPVTRNTLAAFQRHWRPQSVTGEGDSHTRQVLEALLQVAG